MECAATLRPGKPSRMCFPDQALRINILCISEALLMSVRGSRESKRPFKSSHFEKI
jgi:hypothetical protein